MEILMKGMDVPLCAPLKKGSFVSQLKRKDLKTSALRFAVTDKTNLSTSVMTVI